MKKNIILLTSSILLNSDSYNPTTELTEKILQSLNQYDSVTRYAGKIKVDYKPTNEGSERIISNLKLANSTTELTLKYKLRLCENFVFSKGGKLPGLGSLFPTTGGNPMEDDSWSVRLMFGGQGQIIVYKYTQDNKTQYGESLTVKGIHIKPNIDYLMSLSIKLNNNNNNGEIKVNINGKNVLNEKMVTFRRKNTESSKISTVLFQTFFGGHTPEWKPKDRAGNIVNTCAYFWDIQTSDHLI